MPLRSRILRIIIGPAMLSLGLAACGGGSPTSPAYVPANDSSILAPNAKVAISSTCGDRVHIVLLGVVNCKFKEKNYGGNFKITVATKGLVSIDPLKGTKDTKFTVTGLILGKGYFLIRDDRKNTLKVRVRVTS
jgi:hypothetical protein